MHIIMNQLQFSITTQLNQAFSWQRYEGLWKIMVKLELLKGTSFEPKMIHDDSSHGEMKS